MTFLLAAAAKAAAPVVKLASPSAQQAAQAQAQAQAQLLQQRAPMPQTSLQAHAAWLTHGIAGIFVVAAISLIVLLAVQTTKQEGLSGTIGGRVESAYGRVGAEEQLKRVTGFAAVVFVLTGFILSLTGI
ncbi:MAG TPA: preprotein translocase subunit SecG [Alphaproteobacteria bacterium]|nr:preprotein translocase subunit SecG [Alphaproteobacteria bacterium]